MSNQSITARKALSEQIGATTERTLRSATDVEAVVGRVLTEDVLTLAQACAEIRQITGRKPDRATLARWVHRGAGGVQLDAVRVGSQLLTSRQALHRFVAARTAQSVGTR